MNSEEIFNQKKTGANVIPQRLHLYYSQKLTFKKKSSPMIIKKSLCSKTSHILLHNKLNKNLRKASYKILKDLKNNQSMSRLSFRYAFFNVKEIGIVSHNLKHLKRVSSLQLKILNESINLDKFNHLVRCLYYFSALKSLDLAVTYENPNYVKEFKLTEILKSLRNVETLRMNFGWGAVILDLAKVCEGLKTLQKVTDLTLMLSMGGVMNKDAITVAGCLVQLKNLVKLTVDLSNNSISSVGFDSLMQSIKELTKLQELDLALNKNMILVENLASFKEAMMSLTQLRVLKLNFSNMKIFQSSIKDFGDGLSVLKNLKQLQLSFANCHLNEKQIVNIGRGISELSSLSDLSVDLSYNELHDRETLEFIECLKPLKEIKRFSLALASNLIGDFVLFALNNVLSNYRKLETIELNGFSCKLSDKGIKELCGFVEILHNLKDLVLIFNKNAKIHDDGVKKLMEKLTQVKGLKQIRIDLAECKLSQGLEDLYTEKLKNELPQCNTTLLFGY